MDDDEDGVDPFANLQQFPLQLDEFTIAHLHGLSDNALSHFHDLAEKDGATDVQGRMVLNRERLSELAASELHFAVLCQRPAVDVKALAEQQPHLVDAVDSKGHTPLHLAVMNGDLATVSVLLESGAPVNAKTAAAGNTALHLCFDNPAMVKLLLEAGAIAEGVNRFNKSPLDWASEALNNKYGPLAEAKELLANAAEDMRQQVLRAKAQQLKIDERRKRAAAFAVEAERAAAEQAEAGDDWVSSIVGGGSTSGGAGGESGSEGQELVSSIQALAAHKSSTYAKQLYSHVKASRQREAARARQGLKQTQRHMAAMRSDRGLQFERFVSGPHGGREVDKEGVEEHHKAVMRLLAGEKDDNEDEEEDEEDEEEYEEGSYQDDYNGEGGGQEDGGVAEAL